MERQVNSYHFRHRILLKRASISVLNNKNYSSAFFLMYYVLYFLQTSPSKYATPSMLTDVGRCGNDSMMKLTDGNGEPGWL